MTCSFQSVLYRRFCKGVVAVIDEEKIASFFLGCMSCSGYSHKNIFKTILIDIYHGYTILPNRSSHACLFSNVLKLPIAFVQV